MLADNIQGPTVAFMLSFSLVHYLADASVNWHVQLQAARLDDPTFTSAIFDHNTANSRDGWYYCMNQDSGLFAAWPTDGVVTQSDQATRLDPALSGDAALPAAAIAAYQVTSPIELGRFRKGESFFVRARQLANGTDWGEWSQWVEKL